MAQPRKIGIDLLSLLNHETNGLCQVQFCNMGQLKSSTVNKVFVSFKVHWTLQNYDVSAGINHCVQLKQFAGCVQSMRG